MKLPLANAPGKFALVDDDYDGELISGYAWRLTNGHPTTASKFGGKAHKYLARVAYGESLIPKGWVIQAKNGNRLDCRSSNLTCVPFQKVAQDRPQGKQMNSNTNGFRGVVVNNSNKKTYIYVIVAKKYLSKRDGVIKRFDNLEDAARAYDYAAYQRWGEKATLNFPHEPLTIPRD